MDTTTHAQFHLSIGVSSVEESVEFFVRLLGATVSHRDPSGYVNIELAGAQITLKPVEQPVPNAPGLHFGFNLGLAAFDRIAENIVASGYAGLVSAPHTVDSGTPIQRRKMYLKCPSGYLVELKGYAADGD